MNNEERLQELLKHLDGFIGKQDQILNYQKAIYERLRLIEDNTDQLVIKKHE